MALTGREDYNLSYLGQLPEKLGQAWALHHQHTLRVELAAHAHQVCLDVGRQPRRPLGREAADQGAVQIKQHAQLALRASGRIDGVISDAFAKVTWEDVERITKDRANPKD